MAPSLDLLLHSESRVDAIELRPADQRHRPAVRRISSPQTLLVNRDVVIEILRAPCVEHAVRAPRGYTHASMTPLTLVVDGCAMLVENWHPGAALHELTMSRGRSAGQMRSRIDRMPMLPTGIDDISRQRP